MKVLSSFDMGSVSRILNLPNGVALQEPATVAQLNAAIEGLNFKNDVDVLAPANVVIATPGATIDGVTMVANYRVLLNNQTAPAENGVYVWTGAAVAMTRAADMNLSTEFNQAIVSVLRGTSANTSWRCTAVDPTVGTTAITFVSFGSAVPAATTVLAGIAALATQAEVDAGVVTNKIVTPATLAARAGGVKKFTQAIGDGTLTSIVVTHNLNTRDIGARAITVAAPYDQVVCDIQATTVNTATFIFAAAPAAGAYRAVIIG